MVLQPRSKSKRKKEMSPIGSQMAQNPTKVPDKANVPRLAIPMVRVWKLRKSVSKTYLQIYWKRESSTSSPGHG